MADSILHGVVAEPGRGARSFARVRGNGEGEPRKASLTQNLVLFRGFTLLQHYSPSFVGTLACAREPRRSIIQSSRRPPASREGLRVSFRPSDSRRMHFNFIPDVSPPLPNTPPPSRQNASRRNRESMKNPIFCRIEKWTVTNTKDPLMMTILFYLLCWDIVENELNF